MLPVLLVVTLAWLAIGEAVLDLRDGPDGL